MCPIAAPYALAGRYRCESLIATGGMGEVWSAVDEVLDRRVAVKVLRAEYAADDNFRARLRAEARAAAAVNHPAVVEVFDFGEQDDVAGPVAYLVMEFVEGESLADRLQRSGVLSPVEVRDLIVATARGLAAAHERGLVHRDIKPANLLCTPDDRIKIVDFGIARAADAVSLTRTGTIVGSAQYLSPEQAAGQQATTASDLYSLGVVAYAALCGRPPFTGGSDIAVAMAHLRGQVPPLPDPIPADLRALVIRMLSKRPDQRPRTAHALAAEAAALSLVEPVAVVPAESAPTAVLEPRPTRVLPESDLVVTDGPWRRPIAWALTAAFVLLVSGIGVAVGGGSHPTRTPKAHPSASGASAVHETVAHKKAPRPTVQITPAIYVGRPLPEVQAALAKLGVLTSYTTLSSTEPPGTVLALSRSGRVPIGRTVMLTIAAAPSPPTPPGHQPGHGHGGGPGPGKGKDKGDD